MTTTDTTTDEVWVDLAVPAAEQAQVAQALLDASGDNHRHEVRAITGGFCVPEAVAKAAGLLGDAPAEDEAKTAAKTAAKGKAAAADGASA